VGKSRKKRKKRGYFKYILVSIEPMKAYIWRVYSVRIKPLKVIPLGRKWKNATERQLYHYFDKILDVFRPIFDKGVRSVLLISENEDVMEEFEKHMQDHHQWVFENENGHPLTLRMAKGAARDLEQAYGFVELEETQELEQKMLAQEADHIIQKLNKCMMKDNGIIKVTLKEIERIILPRKKHRRTWADYLIMTDEYMDDLHHKKRNRLNRIIAIAGNKGVKQRIIDAETPGGQRLDEFGGIACFLEIDRRFEMI